MPPHYSSDGARYWTGTRWIPAVEVLSPPPPMPPPAPPTRAPRRSAWSRTRGWAAGLSAVLVVLVAAGVLGLRLEGRGTPSSATLAVPPAASALRLPFTRGVGSAAFYGTLTTGGATEEVTGAVEFTPGRALELTLSRASGVVAQYLDCAGIGYRLAQPGGAWTASPRVSLLDTALGWAGGPPPPGLRVAGWQAVAGEPAWHLVAPSSGAAWWIGATTGRPLRFVDRSSRGTVKLTFTGFGKQPAITVPPADDVSTLTLQGAAGEMVAAPGLELNLSMVDVTPRVLAAAPAGYEYRAVYLSYQNLAPEPVKLDNMLTLTDAYGAQYQEASNVQMPPVLPRNQDVDSGQTVSGWDVFLVSRGAWSLTLRMGPPPEQQSIDFVLSIPLA